MSVVDRLVLIHRIQVAEVDRAAGELANSLHWVHGAVRKAEEALADGTSTVHTDGVLKALGPQLDASLARLSAARLAEQLMRQALDDCDIRPERMPAEFPL